MIYRNKKKKEVVIAGLKPKKSPRPSLSLADKKAWPVFSVFIRLRDTDRDGYGKCFTCNRIIFWRDGDCGHGIPRQHKGTKYNECNNHLQCKKCNGFEGGMREEYKSEVDKKYGSGTWDKLLITSKSICKRGVFEYEALIDLYKDLIKEILPTKNTSIQEDVKKQLKIKE